MKKQGLNVSIHELKLLIRKLENKSKEDKFCLEYRIFLVGIKNKTPEYSDTWELCK